MASETDTKYAEPDYARSTKKKTDYPWYSERVDKYLTPETRNFLEKYSQIPKEQQSEHVHEIRDKAWAIRSYPCTGLGVWLVPYIPRSLAYSDIIQRLKDGGILLDIGCFLGSDLRQLVYDSAPSDRLYGLDIVSHWDVGFDMYRDRDSFKAHFIQGDVMSEDNPNLSPLEGSVDIISISAVMHQWDYNTQLECAKKLVRFSKPGSIVIGYQIGNVEGKPVSLGKGMPETWRHSDDSMKKMWEEQVGKGTGTVWEAKARLLKFEEIGWDPKDQAFLGDEVRVIDFVATRKE